MRELLEKYIETGDDQYLRKAMESNIKGWVVLMESTPCKLLKHPRYLRRKVPKGGILIPKDCFTSFRTRKSAESALRRTMEFNEGYMDTDWSPNFRIIKIK